MLHAEVPVIDLHADTPMLGVAAGYNMLKRHKRRLPKRLHYAGHVDAPRMHDGGLAAQIFGMWTVPYPQRNCPKSIHRQLDVTDKAIRDSLGDLVRCWTGEDVRRAHASGALGVLSGIEGGQALCGRAEEVLAFASRGVRYIGLMHFSANALGYPAYGKGADDTQGLTPVGYDVVAEMERCGVIVDLAHINRRGFFDAVDAMHSPPIVSHTGVAGVHPHWRNIDDDQVRTIANAGGCIGVIFARRFLGGDDIDALCDHILHIINIAGEDVPALGSDFDGFVIPPKGLEDVACLPHLTQALSERGLPHRVLKKLLGENALRVLDAVLPNTRLW